MSYYKRFLNEYKFNIHICNSVISSSHSHSFFEIAYVLSGSAVHYLDGDKKIIKKGDYLIMDYDANHSYIKNGSEDLKIINCLFLAEFIDKSLKNHKNFDDIVNNYMIKFNNPNINISPVNYIFFDEKGEIEKILKDCLEEYENKEPNFLEIIRLKLIEIIILTMRKNNSSLPVSSDFVCQYIIKYCAEHITEKNILNNISKELNFSVSYLSKKFKENMNISFTSYIQKIRIEKCLFLLSNTNKKISETAFLCGYNDMKYFYYVFKKYVGMTPKEYRKK